MFYKIIFYLKNGGDFHITFKRLLKIKLMALSYVPLETIKLLYETFFNKSFGFREISMHHFKCLSQQTVMDSEKSKI